MGRRRTALVLALVMALSVAPSAAAAGAAASYHGTWDSASVCGSTFPVSGTWNVALKPNGTAEVTVVTFVSGKVHSVWGGNFWRMPWQQAPAGSDRFTVTNARGLVFDLASNGELTYTLPAYCDGGSDAWILGHLGR